MEISAIKRIYKYIFITVAVLSIAGCATHYTSAASYDPFGFFSGILHGFLFPIALFGKIVAWFLSFVGINVLENVQFVGRPNTGFLFYYIGYFFGLSMWGGGAAK